MKEVRPPDQEQFDRERALQKSEFSVLGEHREGRQIPGSAATIDLDSPWRVDESAALDRAWEMMESLTNAR